MHFQNFPADKLIKSQAVDSCQDYFMSMIKEVCIRRLIRFACCGLHFELQCAAKTDDALSVLYVSSRLTTFAMDLSKKS